MHSGTCGYSLYHARLQVRREPLLPDGRLTVGELRRIADVVRQACNRVSQRLQHLR